MDKKAPLLYLLQCMFGINCERIIRNVLGTQRIVSISSIVRMHLNWKYFNPEDFFHSMFTKSKENSLKNLGEENWEIGLKVRHQVCLHLQYNATEVC